MIWRPNLTHQDYIKHDIQSMTTKFSIRPSGKTKMKRQIDGTNDYQTNHHSHFDIIKTPSKVNIEDIVMNKVIDNDKIMKMIINDQQNHINDDNEEDEMEDEDDEDEIEYSNNNNNNNNNKINCNDDTIKEIELVKTVKNNDNDNDVANQGVFLNFSSDLSPQISTRKRKKTTSTKPQKTAYKVNGVNILNRKNLDSKTAIERMQKRRENHNYIERRRRDTINSTIFELSQVVPLATWSGQKPNKGNILKATLDYVLALQEENRIYKERLNEQSSSTIPTLIPAITSPISSLSNESFMNHSSPIIASPSKNDETSLSPIPVHKIIPTTTLSSSNDHSINNNKKTAFIPIKIDENEKAYNNICHY